MERRIGHDIMKLDRLINQELRSNNLNLSGVQCFLISQLYLNGGKMNQNEVLKLFTCRRSSLTTLINNLEKEEYIQRCKDSNDKRINIISLTDKGYKYSEIIKNNIDNNEEKLNKNLSEDEKRVLFSLFDKLLNNLKEEV